MNNSLIKARCVPPPGREGLSSLTFSSFYLAEWPTCAGLWARASGWSSGGRGPSRRARAGSASSCRVRPAGSRAPAAPTASAAGRAGGRSPGGTATPGCECRSCGTERARRVRGGLFVTHVVSLEFKPTLYRSSEGIMLMMLMLSGNPPTPPSPPSQRVTTGRRLGAGSSSGRVVFVAVVTAFVFPSNRQEADSVSSPRLVCRTSDR